MRLEENKEDQTNQDIMKEGTKMRWHKMGQNEMWWDKKKKKKKETKEDQITWDKTRQDKIRWNKMR